MSAMKTGKLNWRWRVFFLLLPVAAGLLALGIGRISMAPGQVLGAIGEVFPGKRT